MELEGFEDKECRQEAETCPEFEWHRARPRVDVNKRNELQTFLENIV